jgi:crotonobetainyl-CoA:carnitine CoA-transferase CaiB-like acyl-CoA transferase
VAAEQIVEFSAYGNLLTRDGNHSPAATPQNVYRTGDGDESWVAISVPTDEQWMALSELLALTARREDEERVDAEVAAWCKQHTGDEIVERLWQASVPVAIVLQPHQQADLDQLRFRQFFEDVEHPVFGAARHSTLPMRFSSGPERFHVRHAPLFGEHTTSLLSSIGVSAEDIGALEDARVTATAPKPATGVAS